MLEGLAVCGFGALGGVANAVLLEGGFRLPAVVEKDEHHRVLDFGFIGAVFLGAVAALATFLLGTSELEPARRWGIALISGVAGGNILTSLAQKQATQVLKAQVEALEEVVRRYVSPG